uniref:NADH-ubiquinone oxidoreductase chain 2 n=1 Tax=Scolytinae sp. 6 ACP-2013 TaxID=1434579 RepID=A0A3G3ME76_9CUCU|nr:NADH dehydrogenase subunit 2 [Scolytinae sp. 6 ACP-2013]
MNFYKNILYLFLMVSSIITISASTWLTAWLGLEFNIMAILPIMKSTNKFNSESTIKYFIIQAMASSILLISSMFIFNFMNYLYMYIILTALFMKVGAAPFHFWLPEIISGMNWFTIFIILTWQKLAPMILMKNIIIPHYFYLIIIFSVILGSLQGLNQTCMRKIMVFSSINHMGWMISSLMMSIKLWMLYFFLYLIINWNLIFLFYKNNIYYFTHLNKLITYNKNMKLVFLFNFFSLGGMPPFLGFLPKWMIINLLINNYYFSLIFIMIIMTIMSLYFYTRILLAPLSMNILESKICNFSNSFLYTMNFMFLFIITPSLIFIMLF